MRWEILEAFGAAAELAGVPAVADFNGGDNHGSGYFHVNQRGGLRWSAASAFLKPALRRPNLVLRTAAHACRLLIRDGVCQGVEWMQDKVRMQAHARAEVVVATGAVATPPLLERSGLGHGGRLRDLGIEVVRDLPGVGENLQDHLQLRPHYRVSGAATMNALYASWWRRPLMALEYALLRRGPMSMAPSQFGAFARSGPDQERPNVQFHIQPLSLDRFGEPLHPYPAITVSVCNLRPTSRGFVHAQSADPLAPPVIQPNYLSTPQDEQVAVESLRLARRILAQPPMARFDPREVRPGPEAQDEEALLEGARGVASTIFHPVGTARMGRRDDPMAVTDARLRVRNVGRLRIADASVMPLIVSGNTNSPTMMIAEKAARMMIEDARAAS